MESISVLFPLEIDESLIEQSFAKLNAYGAQFDCTLIDKQDEIVSDIKTFSYACLMDQRARRSAYTIVKNLFKENENIKILLEYLVNEKNIQFLNLTNNEIEVCANKLFLALLSAGSKKLSSEIFSQFGNSIRVVFEENSDYLIYRDGIDPYLANTNTIARDVRGFNYRFKPKTNVL